MRTGLALGLKRDQDMLRFELVPVRSTKADPAPLLDTDRALVLEALAKRSDESVREMIKGGYIEADAGILASGVH